jgi:hypothetical protein
MWEEVLGWGARGKGFRKKQYIALELFRVELTSKFSGVN